MRLNDIQLKVLKNISYYERYLQISSSNRPNEKLENQNQNKVIDILSSLGYESSYIKKENFYQIKDKFIDNYKFYFRICLKYGICELIFGAQNSETKLNIGGSASRTCKLIEVALENRTEGYIKDPAFSSYEELKSILKESLSLFEDLKSEVIKLQP